LALLAETNARVRNVLSPAKLSKLLCATTRARQLQRAEAR
jgi:hypothetical protein